MKVKNDPRIELSNLSNWKEEASLPMCGFVAQLVENRTGIAEVTGSNPIEALLFFFQASSFQLLKLENSLRGSFFAFAKFTVVEDYLGYFYSAYIYTYTLG